MISKELSSEVLDGLNEGWSILDYYTDKNEVCISFVKDNIEFDEEIINIHELAHKVKEWAIKIEYQLISFQGFNKKWYADIEWEQHVRRKKSFSASTEPEAIFKAGQWILDNKEVK